MPRKKVVHKKSWKAPDIFIRTMCGRINKNLKFNLSWKGVTCKQCLKVKKAVGAYR